MPVPTSLTDLSTTPASNFPAGSESPTTLDDYMRAHAALMATLRDRWSAFGLTLTDDADAAAARTTLDVYSRSEVDTLSDAWQPGDVKTTAASAAPAGWLACDGAAVSRTTYAALFTAISTTFGVGDGATTFNLPDARNRVLIGSGGLYAIGATGGSKDAIAVSHTHTASSSVTDPGHVHGIGPNTGGYGTGAVGYNVVRNNLDGGPYADFDTRSKTTGISVSTTVNSGGSSGTNANLPPYLALLTIIKT